jgi:murein DD-endopeptidase MepM/ murein hydrolase activator NlpD
MRRKSGKRPVALVLVFTLLVLSPAAARAQSKEDVERANVARDRALQDLRTLDTQLDEALLEYHTVNGELEQLTYRIGLLFDRVADYEAEVSTLRGRAQDFVVEAYKAGGAEMLDVALNADSIQDILTSRLILERATDNDLVALGRLDAVRREMDRLKDELSVDQERVSELRDLADNVVHRLDSLQQEAAAAYAEAAAVAADELRAYEAEQARLAAIRAAREAARTRGAAAGVGDTATPGFQCPVPSARFINDWGFPRSGGRTHKGTDMFASRGTPVLAVASGTVSLKNYRLGGIVAFIRADYGVTYYFAHLDRYADGISTGARVERGDVIGYVGNTGNAIGTSPHLHFQIHPNHGAAVNPYPTLRRHC